MKVNHVKPLLLIFPFDLLSHYLRCLMLARHFTASFEIMFVHSDRYAEFILQEGYQTFHCKALSATHVMDRVKKFDFSWLEEDVLESVYLDQVRVMQTLRPVAVLGDTSPTLKMAAEKTGVTFIALMNGYMSKYYSLTRKMSRTHPVYRYVNIFSKPVLDLITEKGEAVTFYKIHRPFKKIRSASQLLKKISYPDELEGDVTLICDLVSLFPQKNVPSNYTIIAPLFYETKTKNSGILNRLDKGKKTIFVTMGSTGDWNKVTFLNDPYFQKFNIVTAADNDNVLHAANIIKTAFVNSYELFNVTDLVICQGGNGTIYQALCYGIPLLCKTNNFEQEWNVEALERLHAGASLDNTYKVNDCIGLVEEWIEKDRAAIIELSEQIKKETAKLGGVIKQLAAGLLVSVVDDLQHR